MKECDVSEYKKRFQAGVQRELTVGLENDYPSEASQRIATSPKELGRRKIPD
jgi:hypothetical protein